MKTYGLAGLGVGLGVSGAYGVYGGARGQPLLLSALLLGGVGFCAGCVYDAYDARIKQQEAEWALQAATLALPNGNYGFFNPTSYAVNTAATTGAQQVAQPAKQGMSGDAAAALVTQGAGLAQSIIGLFGNKQPAAPVSSGPDTTALLLQQQEAAAAQTRTLLLVGGGLGLLGLLGIGAVVLSTRGRK
jgi:hypothetical protein